MTTLAPDWTISQDWPAYTAQDHATWDALFARQSALLPNRAAPEFLAGLDILRMDQPGIPDFAALNQRLHAMTGWQVVAGRFIRAPSQLDYLQEPDVFHDVFGHVPLLANPVFADYMQAYGEGGLRSAHLGALDHLARLYWYTVEFGLIRTPQGLRIYGAGIVSSRTESLYALEDPSPHRLAFEPMRVMRTRYRIDDFQQTYFVIDSFEDLLRQTVETDFAPLYAALAGLPDIAPDTRLATDR